MSIQSGRDKYERKANREAWQRGIDNADSPGQGLQDAGVDNLDTGRFDRGWREGVDDANYEVDPDAWFEAMSDASNWNY